MYRKDEKMQWYDGMTVQRCKGTVKEGWVRGIAVNLLSLKKVYLDNIKTDFNFEIQLVHDIQPSF